MKTFYFFVNLCFGIFAEIATWLIVVGAPLLWAFSLVRGITALKLLALTPLFYVVRRSVLHFVIKRAEKDEGV